MGHSRLSRILCAKKQLIHYVTWRRCGLSENANSWAVHLVDFTWEGGGFTVDKTISIRSDKSVKRKQLLRCIKIDLFIFYKMTQLFDHSRN